MADKLIYEPLKPEIARAYKKELEDNGGVIRVASGYTRGTSKEKFHIPATFSDETVDRYGDVILASSFNTTLNKKQFFEGNNPLLWSHNMVSSHNKMPLGNIVSPDFKDKRFDGIADFRAASVDEFAAKILELYKIATMNAFSVGFRAKVVSFDAVKEGQDGLTFLEVELLEVSAVPIPANPSALAKAVGSGMITSEFVEQHFKAFVDHIVQNKTLFLPAQYRNLDFFDGVTFKMQTTADTEKEVACTCKVQTKTETKGGIKANELQHKCRFCGHDSVVKYVRQATDLTLIENKEGVEVLEEKDFCDIKYLDATCTECGIKESQALEIELSL